MIALLQRVSEASVSVAGTQVAEIGKGLLVFVAFEHGDGPAQVGRMLQRIVGYRVFADEQGRMNHSLGDIAAGLLLVPQFTLAADTRKGMRPSFTPAAMPEVGQRLFARLCEQAAELPLPTAYGVFGADMQVALINDGPVTLTLSVAAAAP